MVGANGADCLAKTVITQDDGPIDTGLLDKDGVRLYRVEERHQIGFIPRK